MMITVAEILVVDTEVDTEAVVMAAVAAAAV
jgi:hypothetical protein